MKALYHIVVFNLKHSQPHSVSPLLLGGQLSVPPFEKTGIRKNGMPGGLVLVRYLPDGDLLLEAVVQGCSVKKVFLEVWQNSQENTCAKVSFLIKLQA